MRMAKLYFKEKRLFLNAADEFVVRLFTSSWYVVLGAVTFFFLFSGVPTLSWYSVLLLFFLIDRIIHFGEGERNLGEFTAQSNNIARALTPASIRILSHAFRRTKITHQSFYLSLLEALAERKDIQETLARLDIDPDAFLKRTQEVLHASATEEKETQLIVLARIEKLAFAAYANAVEGKERFIDTRNLFVALVAASELPREAQALLESFGVVPKDVQAAVIFGRWRRRLGRVRFLPASIGGFANRPKFLRHRVMNRAWTARPTPTLDEYTTDLTDLARAERAGLLVGHTQEVEMLLHVLSRDGKPNALLVGEAGSGKETIISHLAFRMIKDEVPPVLFDKRLVALELNALVADAPAEVLSGRLKTITEEIIRAGNIVLYLPDIHRLFKTDGKALNVMELLFPIVRTAEIPVVGDTYPREFKEFIAPHSDFLEQFEVVRVEEISEDDAIKVLIYASLLLERQYGIFISFLAIREAVMLAHRYFHRKLLPGSALDLLKQALAEAKEGKEKILKANGVTLIAERMTRIPIQQAGEEESEKLLSLEATIHERLVGQDEAVREVARAIREYRSGLARKGGPIASFLFVGPTGVGKTQLAKLLAKIQFGSEEAMKRFDMSEYQEKASIERLIGSPNGEHSGTLTDAVLQDPYSLVLLDEFEKANPDILNLFLQVLDDGRLTDSLGRTVSFTNTIIIATSNAHSEFIKTEIEHGKQAQVIEETLKKKLTDFFKPELLNRFSDVIMFRNLTEEETYQIAKLLVKELADSLKEGNGFSLECDDAALRELARLGYDPVFGARPLRQVISDTIKSVLAEKILKREVRRGDTVRVHFFEGVFAFSVEKV